MLKPGCAGRMQGLIAGHVSQGKRGHNLSCHTWLESLRVLYHLQVELLNLEFICLMKTSKWPG